MSQTKMFWIALLAVGSVACAQDSTQQDLTKQGQDLTKRITFQCKAETVDLAFAQLNKVSGVNFTADPAMKKEVLLISIKDERLDQLMDKIAKVTSGNWMPLGDELRLVPDSAVRIKQENAWFDVRAKALTAALQKASGQPGAVAALQMQDPSALAQIGPDQRIVFSSSPTAAQLAAQGFNVDFLAALFKGSPYATGEEADAEQKAMADVGKIILAVSHSENALQARLTVYSKKGRSMMVESADVSDPPNPPTVYSVPATLAKPDSTAVQTSTATAELWKDNFQKLDAKRDQLSADAVKTLQHPEVNDPLSFFASDALLQRAQECGEPIVADLPDSVAYTDADTAAGFMAAQCANGRINVDDSKGWILVSPGEPVESRTMRADRPALAALVQAATPKYGAPLAAMAAFAVAEGHSPVLDQKDGDASVAYLRAFIPGWQDYLFEGNHFNVLRFFGELTPDQQQAALAELPVSVGQLSQDALLALDSVVFGASGRTEVRTESPVGTAPPPNRAPMPASAYHNNVKTLAERNTYLEEPTESLANGFPPEATVCLVATSPRTADLDVSRINLTFLFHLLPTIWMQSSLEAHVPQPDPGH